MEYLLCAIVKSPSSPHFQAPTVQEEGDVSGKQRPLLNLQKAGKAQSHTFFKTTKDFLEKEDIKKRFDFHCEILFKKDFKKFD